MTKTRGPKAVKPSMKQNAVGMSLPEIDNDEWKRVELLKITAFQKQIKRVDFIYDLLKEAIDIFSYLDHIRNRRSEVLDRIF